MFSCTHCGKEIWPRLDEMGPTAKTVPFSTFDGDFGCDPAPDSCEEGVGSHIPKGTQWTALLL